MKYKYFRTDKFTGEEKNIPITEIRDRLQPEYDKDVKTLMVSGLVLQTMFATYHAEEK